METVKGFKGHNEGWYKILAGPWRQPNGDLRYVYEADGYARTADVPKSGRYAHASTINLIPDRREVKGSDLKVGDRIVAVNGEELSYVSGVRLARTGANGHFESWICTDITYTVEDTQ